MKTSVPFPIHIKFFSITNLAFHKYTDVETPSNNILSILIAIDENIDNSFIMLKMLFLMII